MPDFDAIAAEPVPEKSIPGSAEPERDAKATVPTRLVKQANVPQLFPSRKASELKNVLRWIEEGDDY